MLDAIHDSTVVISRDTNVNSTSQYQNRIRVVNVECLSVGQMNPERNKWLDIQ
jgi:hypothetical protein